MIIYLYGADTYRSKQKLHDMVEEFKKKRDPNGLNVAELDGATMILDDFRKAVLTQSFLVQKRLVVIKDLSKNKDKGLAGQLCALLQDKQFPNEEVVIIFWEGAKTAEKRGKKTKRADEVELFTWLKTQPYVYEFPALPPGQLEQWVIQETTKNGATITPGALTKLLAFVGNDLWQLNNELAKLSAYNLVIDEVAVGLLVHAKVDEDIFGLMDAVSQRDKKNALRLLESQRQAGLELMYLHTMLVRQFRLLLQARDFLDNNPARGATSEVLSQTLSIHPFVAKKVLAQARNFSMVELKKLYQKLVDIELAMKTSRSSPEALLTLFVTDAVTRR